MLILHNPRCSKSREALHLLENSSCELEIRDYLKDPLNKEEIIDLLNQLGLKAKDLVRSKEEIYKSLFSEKTPTNLQLIKAMVKYPVLIERPIIIKDGKATIGRPVTLVIDLIEN
jgi:arsenate reductase (glutaredoxin)